MSDHTVFVVDDDIPSAESLRALMIATGFQAEVFHSAESFLDAYDGHSSGCLVLDIRLGGMSGLELQRMLIASGVPLSIFIISGHADEADRAQARFYGAIAILDKPFACSELCTLIRQEFESMDRAPTPPHEKDPPSLRPG